MQNKSSDDWSKVERNLNGDYQFDIGMIMKQGWQLTLLTKWTYLRMFMFVLVLIVVVVVAIIQYMGIVDPSQLDKQTEAILQIVITILMAPFVTAISLFGYHASLGKQGNFNDLFALLPRSAIICIATLFVSVVVGIGFQLLIIPGIYLAVATDFTLLLIADKKLRPFAAVGLSIKMVTRYWLPFLKLLMIFLVLTAVIFLTLGIAFFLLGPLYYNVKGILYRDLFGAAETTIESNGNTTGELTFNA